MKKSRISQQQIAKDLGVSQTLVSMALNGRRNAVSKESYEEIWSYARRRGYRPKGMAAELLPAPKSTSVGFVLRTGVKLYKMRATVVGKEMLSTAMGDVEVFRVTVNGDFSGKLATQIRNGAPFDVFLSADREFADALHQAGLTTGA